MKQFFCISAICLLIACSSSKQSTSNLDGLPKLSYSQMIEDHDTLVSLIKQTSPIIYFNKEVRGIDFNKHAENLRKQINHKTTTPEFLQIVEKTLNSAQDGHTNRLGPALLDHTKKYGIPSGTIKDIDSTNAKKLFHFT